MFYTNNHCCCRKITRHVFNQNYQNACTVVIMYMLAQFSFCFFCTIDSRPHLDDVDNFSSAPCSTKWRSPLSSPTTISLPSSPHHCTIQRLYGPPRGANRGRLPRARVALSLGPRSNTNCWVSFTELIISNTHEHTCKKLWPMVHLVVLYQPEPRRTLHTQFDKASSNFPLFRS